MRETFQKKVNVTFDGQYNYEEAAKAIRSLMCAFKFNQHSSEFANGEYRIVRMYAEFWAGLFTKPPEITLFPNNTGNEMIIVRGIDFVSTCSHHFIPFTGIADVGYMPDEHIVGISKLARVVDYWAARPQIQERLTNQILNYLLVALKTHHVAVRIKATHSCIACRGAHKRRSELITCAWAGAFKNHVHKQEFLAAVREG